MNFFFAMMETETEGHTDKEYERLAEAMNELKAAANAVGKFSFYQIKYEYQYRKAEHEIKMQVR